MMRALLKICLAVVLPVPSMIVPEGLREAVDALSCKIAEIHRDALRLQYDPCLGHYMHTASPDGSAAC